MPDTFEEFIHGLGFDSNPFAKTNAAQEERLERYFVRPKYFTSLQGDPSQPSSSLVYAPRGSGKTAQKLMLERFCPEAGILPISYDYFPVAADGDTSDFDTDYHLNNILRQGLLATIAYMVKCDMDARALTDQNRKNFAALADQYIGMMAVEEIDSFTYSLLGRIEKLKNIWNEWRGLGTAVLMPLLSKVGITQLPALAERKTVGNQPTRHHFQLLKNITKDVGFRSIYVLLDRVDETQWTGNNPERSYQLISRLLRDLTLLDDPYVGWKFFIWDAVEPYCRDDARPDRVEQFALEWSEGELREMMSLRLAAYSDGRIRSFQQILEEEVRDEGEEWLILFSNRSPRNVVRMANDVLSEQAERDSTAKEVTAEAVEAGITKFCEYSITEQYPRDHVRDMRRAGRVTFTISYLASDVYKEHQNSTRNRIRGWEASGIVRKNGTIKLEAGVRPSNYYMVSDPRVVRYIYERRSVREIIDAKSLPCSQCGRTIFSEFENREDDFVCPFCERPAVA